jgi:hypothetical protein
MPQCGIHDSNMDNSEVDRHLISPQCGNKIG